MDRRGLRIDGDSRIPRVYNRSATSSAEINTNYKYLVKYFFFLAVNNE
jgi:hypothetical protein